jgi:hypothetical protein
MTVLSFGLQILGTGIVAVLFVMFAAVLTVQANREGLHEPRWFKAIFGGILAFGIAFTIVGALMAIWGAA